MLPAAEVTPNIQPLNRNSSWNSQNMERRDGRTGNISKLSRHLKYEYYPSNLFGRKPPHAISPQILLPYKIKILIKHFCSWPFSVPRFQNLPIKGIILFCITLIMPFAYLLSHVMDHFSLRYVLPLYGAPGTP